MEKEQPNDAALWRKLFQNWPPRLPPRGVIVTTFEEQFPFVGYLIAGDMLLLERRTPDNLGGRKMLLPVTQILAVKITDPVKGELFEEVGFRGKLPEGS